MWGVYQIYLYLEKDHYDAGAYDLSEIMQFDDCRIKIVFMMGKICYYRTSTLGTEYMIVCTSILTVGYYGRMSVIVGWRKSDRTMKFIIEPKFAVGVTVPSLFYDSLLYCNKGTHPKKINFLKMMFKSTSPGSRKIYVYAINVWELTAA
jgi:hypothetical protein